MNGSGEGGQYSDSGESPERLPARRFRPGLAATLFTAFFLPLLLVLGAWQLNRAAEKRALFAQFAAGNAEPVALGTHPAGLDELPRYTRVRATGRYLDGQQFLLDNMVEDGVAGYRVLTPLALEDDRVLMVDRGWIPKTFGREAELPDVPVAAGPREVTGRLDRLPRPGIDLDVRPGAGWPRIVQFPTAEELAGDLRRQLVPGLLLLDPDAPDGFQRNWRPSDFGPERHIGYAVQWYALAGTLVVLYLVWAFRKTD